MAKSKTKAMPKADNGKGFKKVAPGETKGKGKFIPPWARKKDKK